MQIYTASRVAMCHCAVHHDISPRADGEEDQRSIRTAAVYEFQPAQLGEAFSYTKHHQSLLAVASMRMSNSN